MRDCNIHNNFVTQLGVICFEVSSYYIVYGIAEIVFLSICKIFKILQNKCSHEVVIHDQSQTRTKISHNCGNCDRVIH